MSKTLVTSPDSSLKIPRRSAADVIFEEDEQDEQTPLRIALDGTALYGVYGGVEYSLWNLLLALQSLDSPHHWTVFIPHDGPPDTQLAAFGAQWQWRRLPFK